MTLPPEPPSTRSPAAGSSTGEPGASERLPLSTQLFRFVVTGGVSAVVDYGLLVLGMALGLGYALAKAVSWVFGTVTAYLINSRWTFTAAATKRRFAAVVLLYVVTFVLQVGTFTLLYPPLEAWLGVAGAQFVGFVIAQGLATTINFVVQRTLIFRD